MPYTREVAIKLTLDEIRCLTEALRTSKQSYIKELEASTTKNGKAKKGEKKNKTFLLDQIKRFEKLYFFFENLF